MRWLAAILLIVNVALYLYISTSERERQLLSQPTKTAVNEQSMLLSQEIESLNEIAAPLLCYRIGPVQSDEKLQQLRKIIDNFQLSYQQSVASGRTVFYYDLLLADEQMRQMAQSIISLVPTGQQEVKNIQNLPADKQVLASYVSRDLAQKMSNRLREAKIAVTLRKRQLDLGAEKRYWFKIQFENAIQKQRALVVLQHYLFTPRLINCKNSQ